MYIYIERETANVFITVLKPHESILEQDFFKILSVTVACCLSPVFAVSWLRQARPSDEPHGARADGGQDELVRRSKDGRRVVCSSVK